MLTFTLLFALAIGLSADRPEYCRQDGSILVEECVSDNQAHVGDYDDEYYFVWSVYLLECIFFIQKQFLGKLYGKRVDAIENHRLFTPKRTNIFSKLNLSIFQMAMSKLHAKTTITFFNVKSGY